MSDRALDFIFNPQSIAIIGASEGVSRLSGNYVQHLINYGYKGSIYPINPNKKEIFGIQAYPDLKSIPGTVDYVIHCIALENTQELLKACAQKNVRTVHILAGRGRETGHKEAFELEQDILRSAKQYGIRLIGPNCLGIYHPRVGISFGWDLPQEPGNVGALLQSGGNSLNLVRWGALRGLRFSKVISYGNALDLNECDFLDYLANDSETRVILSYVEGVQDARRYFQALRDAARKKPVIIIKGGRTKSGNVAAASHTAAIAGSSSVWQTALNQAGAVSARDFEDLIDLGVAFSLIPHIAGNRLGLVGGGGGQGVLAADECEEMGFDLTPLPPEIREEIRKKSPVIWDWVGNPVDMSIMRDSGTNSIEVLWLIARHPNFDFIIAQVTEDLPTNEEDFTTRSRHEYEGYLAIFKEVAKPLVVVLGDRSLGLKEIDNWRWRLFAEIRMRLVEAKVPFFPTIGRAARAVKELRDYYRR